MPAHYVQVIGPHDSCFVGPFADAAGAESFAAGERTGKPQFDFYPMPDADMRQNLREFGECPLLSPEKFTAE